MKTKHKTRINFIVDPRLIQEERSEFILRALQDEKIKVSTEFKESDELNFSVIFSHRKSLRNLSPYKNKLIVLDSNEPFESGNVEKINFNSYEEVTNLVDKLFLVERRQVLENRLKESERLYERIKILNQSIDQVRLRFEASEHKKDFDALLDLELQLLGEEQIDNWNAHFKVFAKKHSQLVSLAVVGDKSLIEEELDDQALVFKLPHKELFLVIRFKSNDWTTQGISLELIVTTVLRTIQSQDQQLIKSDGEIDFWKKIFSKIPYPMAVISAQGDLLIYNESFAKIGILPKECLSFKDQESLEIHQQFYKVRRIEFPINLINASYFVFYTSEGREANLSLSSKPNKGSGVDELGIISSSIAHELNNPLAGILAALSLLSLEEWSEDDLNDLEDMKNGAKRCKELVEIFLGFSRFSPAIEHAPSIKSSLDQAINLLRFRMIEANLRLEIKYNPTLETFSHQMNSSIMSMILYLILSELMTAFAHERLITQTSLTSMSGEVMEFSNQIIIKLDHNFEYEDKIAQSKLIQHLLLFEKLEITFLRQEIRLIYNDSRK